MAPLGWRRRYIRKQDNTTQPKVWPDAPIADIAFACKRDGMSDDRTVVEAAKDGNGFKRWRLLLRPHGFFLFEEMTLQDEICYVDNDGNEGAIVAEAYWMPTHVSGLFESEEAAREDALATLPWLREALTNVRFPPTSGCRPVMDLTWAVPTTKQKMQHESGDMGRDKRLLGAMSLMVVSAVAWLIQAGIVRAYIYSAVMGNWSDFTKFFRVQPPSKYCLDYCVADLPFVAGWTGIVCFCLGFALMFAAWLRPDRKPPGRAKYDKRTAC